MALNKLRGDAPAVAQVWKLTPSDIESGDIFKILINGKSISVTASSTSASALCDDLAEAFNASEIKEFAEITASSSGGYLLLTADTAGRDFIVSTSTTNSETSASIEIEETTKGVSAENEVQKIELAGAYTGGTFTLSNDFGSGTETTAAIAFDASSADVESSLEALASISSGDVSITGSDGGPWFIELRGSFAASEVSEFSVDGSSLTGTNEVNIRTIVNGYGGADTVYLIETVGGFFGVNSGTFTVTVSGDTTAAIDFDATPATLQSALEGLGSVGAGNVEVSGYVSANSGKPGSVFVVRFIEDFAGVNVTLSVNSLNLAIGADVEKLISGGAASWDEVQVFDLGGIDGDNTSGSDRWVYSTEDTSDVTTQSFGRVSLYSDSSTVDYADNVLSSSEAGEFDDYYSQDLDRLDSLYGAGIVARHFVSGSGFIAVFEGPTIDETDQPEGQIGTAGISSTLERSASVSTVIDGGSGTNNEEQSVHLEGSGGTFTLTFDGQTTSGISAGASAATVEAALEALSSIGSGNVSVSGSGTFADPYLVEFISSLGSQNLEEMTGDGSSLSGGSGQVTETTAHVVSVDEVQTITIDPTVTGGTFTLLFEGETTSAIAYNASAATVEAALEALSTVPGVTVAGSSGGPWTVTFDTGSVSGSDVSLLTADESNLTGGAGTQAVTIEETVRSSGPNHWDDPLNWTQGRIPQTGDSLVLENNSTDLKYGIKQRAEFTADPSTDYLTIANHDFRDEQLLTVKSSGVAPAGLTAGNDYYVIYIDKDTIQLESTIGGGAIDITDSGTGTHEIGAEFASVDAYSVYSGELGLDEFNSEGEYYEFRPRFLSFWVADSGDIKIGEGVGSGSPRMNLDIGDSLPGELEIQLTGGSRVSGVPALLLKGQNSSANYRMLGGDVGIAFERGDVAEFNEIIQRGGNLTIGKGHTNGNVKKTGGSLLSLGGTFNGTLSGSF